MNGGTRDGNENGSGDEAVRVEKKRACATQPRRVVDVMWKTGKTWAEEESKQKQESIGTVDANHDNLEISKDAGREARGIQGLSKNCRYRGCVSSLSRVV